MSGLREAARAILELYTLDGECTFCGVRDTPVGCACPFGQLRAALADSTTEVCSTCGEQYGTKAGEYCADTFHCGTKWTPTPDAPPEPTEEMVKGARWVLSPNVVAAHEEISAELTIVAKDFRKNGKYEPRIARAEAHFTVMVARAESFARFVLRAALKAGAK